MIVYAGSSFYCCGLRGSAMKFRGSLLDILGRWGGEVVGHVGTVGEW